MRSVVRVAICLVLAFLGSRAMAQQATPVISSDLPQRDVVNAGTVTVITAPVGGPMSVMGSDMANVLDDGENLRVLRATSGDQWSTARTNVAVSFNAYVESTHRAEAAVNS